MIPVPRGSAESPHPESEPRNTVISTSMTMTGRRFAFLNIPILLSNIRYTGSISFPHTFEFPGQTLGLGDLRGGHPDGDPVPRRFGLGFSLDRRQIVPHQGLDFILRHPLAFFIKVTEGVLGPPIASLRRLAIIVCRFH